MRYLPDNRKTRGVEARPMSRAKSPLAAPSSTFRRKHTTVSDIPVATRSAFSSSGVTFRYLTSVPVDLETASATSSMVKHAGAARIYVQLRLGLGNYLG